MTMAEVGGQERMNQKGAPETPSIGEQVMSRTAKLALNMVRPAPNRPSTSSGALRPSGPVSTGCSA